MVKISFILVNIMQDSFLDFQVFPTKKGLWVSLKDKPMIADNRDWEKMFTDKDNVHFLDLEVKQAQSKHRQGRHGSSRMKG